MLRLWDLDADVAHVIATGHHRSEALAFDGTGRWLVALGGLYQGGYGATVYDLGGAEPPRRLAVAFEGSRVPRAAITGAGRRIAWGGRGHTVATFDGDVVARAPALPLVTPVVAPSPDGRSLVLGDHWIELAAAPELGRRAPVTGPVTYSFEGRWLAGLVGDRIALVDLADARSRHTAIALPSGVIARLGNSLFMVVSVLTTVGGPKATAVLLKPRSRIWPRPLG